MANRYWVGGTGTWDATATTHWSTSSGGAAGASVPGSSDTVFVDSLSGGGTITLSINAVIQAIILTGFTGIFNFGTNTISVNATGTVFRGDATYNYSGTPVVNIISTGSTAIAVSPVVSTEANSVSFNFTGGTYTLTFNSAGKNVNFTGFAGTWTTGSTTIYGNLTLSTGMTVSPTAATIVFGATSGVKTITSNAKTLDFPINFNGVGGTWQLQDDLTIGSTRALTLTNGTLDGNLKTISGASSFSIITGSVNILNISTSLAFTHTSGTLTQAGNNSLGAYTFTAGTLNLSSYALTVPSFSSANTNTRTLAFGTGNIICNGSGGTLWTTATVTGLTVTGTPTVNISYSGVSAKSVLPGALTEANSISFNFTAGTYPLTFLATASYSARNVDFTGFAGTWAARTIASTIYGNLTLSTGMTFAASSGILTFGATSGTQAITSNAKTIDEPLTVNGVGGTVQLADALLMGTTSTLTHTNGTLDLNGKTLTVGTAYTTATGTKNLTFNAGTLVCPAATTTAFNNAAPTGFTTTAGTGTGKISMTAATAKTFVGGGSTYNCTLSNDGAGALTVSGSNTFTTIANGVQPTAFTFTAATTQTVTNWNVSGTAGNLVTIISSTAGVPALLSKASGTVSSNYLSLKDSTATGGAAWYAGANSTNVSGNLGWIFTAPPATSNGNFFFMF